MKFLNKVGKVEASLSSFKELLKLSKTLLSLAKSKNLDEAKSKKINATLLPIFKQIQKASGTNPKLKDLADKAVTAGFQDWVEKKLMKKGEVKPLVAIAMLVSFFGLAAAGAGSWSKSVDSKTFDLEQIKKNLQQSITEISNL